MRKIISIISALVAIGAGIAGIFAQLSHNSANLKVSYFIGDSIYDISYRDREIINLFDKLLNITKTYPKPTYSQWQNTIKGIPERPWIFRDVSNREVLDRVFMPLFIFEGEPPFLYSAEVLKLYLFNKGNKVSDKITISVGQPGFYELRANRDSYVPIISGYVDDELTIEGLNPKQNRILYFWPKWNFGTSFNLGITLPSGDVSIEPLFINKSDDNIYFSVNRIVLLAISCITAITSVIVLALTLSKRKKT